MVSWLLPGVDWKAGGHDLGAGLEELGTLAVWAVAAWYLWLLVRGWLQRRRYRVVGVLDDEDLAELRRELERAERATVGEIVPVVLERSDAHPEGRWLAAIFAALIGSALLSPWIDWNRPALVLASQVALGALGYLAAARLPGFQRAFVRETRATEMAEEQALQEFYGQGLHRTHGESGVLLFVSLFERRVVVLADRGVQVRSEGELWEETHREILEHVARAELRLGLLAGVRRVGAILAQHFPADGTPPNELPDRLVVRRR